MSITQLIQPKSKSANELNPSAIESTSKKSTSNQIEPQSLQEKDQQMARVGLEVFFNIMKAWKVKAKQQMVLLGKPAESTFYNWKKGKVSSLSTDTFERISYVIGIYKALGILFPTRQQADAWPHKPNAAFNQESALDFMLKGSIVNLSDMRRYLDAQRG